MKKVVLCLFALVIVFLCTSSVSVKSVNGIAGYTGAPNSFGTCAQCHFGGSSASSGITITAMPSFTNNEYMTDSLYQVTITASATGFTRYGLDCEILTPAGANAGVISPSTAAGVKTLQAGLGRRDAVHTSPKIGSVASWTFPWKAPASGSVVVYAMVNAVNGNVSTNGDFPLSPVTLSLSPFVIPQDTTQDTVIIDRIAELEQAIGNSKLYPNPATVATQLDYFLPFSGEVDFSINDLRGSVITRMNAGERQAGANSQNFDLRHLEKGVYFLKVNVDRRQVGQKMLLIN